MNRLDTLNPNHYRFTTDVLDFHVLGGLSSFGLDRMRVTIKVHTIRDEYQALRNSIDLYNVHALEKFVRRIAEFLEVGTILTRRALQELITHLENYRLDLLENKEHQEVFEPSKNEKRLAINLLRSKDLLGMTNKWIEKSGVIGEENNRLLMYLIFTSRKMENPLNCICFGTSGSGKTHLQSKVSELIPEQERLSLTSLSANSFYYFKKNELKHKLILIEDLDGADDVLYPLRELQTKKRITKSVVQKGFGGESATKHLTVEGPVSVAGCTTKESLYEDNSNRSFLLYIDESQEQDNRIMDYQRKVFAGKIDHHEQAKASNLLQNCQRLLKPIKVVNPYAEYLSLPSAVFKPRRSNVHYLQCIEVITFYHQHQREKFYDKSSGEEYIKTSIEDIKYANEILKPILLRKSDSLNGATRTYFEKLKNYLKINKEDHVFTNREIRKTFRIAESTLRRYHHALQQEAYIKRREDIGGDSFAFEIVDDHEFRELENSIESALGACLKKLESDGEYKIVSAIGHRATNPPP